MIFSNKRLTKALNRLCGWAGWSAALLFSTPNPKTGFLTPKPIYCSKCVFIMEYPFRWLASICFKAGSQCLSVQQNTYSLSFKENYATGELEWDNNIESFVNEVYTAVKLCFKDPLTAFPYEIPY